ncbi:MAG: M48 family metalloprotease [Fimbriimonadales bacterium]
MKSTEYSKLVDEFTLKWKSSPSEFQKSIDRFALLGIVVLVVAFVLGILLILTLRIWLMIVGCLILYSIVRAIFYRPEKMPGLPVLRKDAPLLFDDVEEIGRNLGAPGCHGVYVDFSFNAAAIQFHTFGIVGPMRNYVLVGIPLMDALSREHVRSTLAHEIGHLMLKHGDRTRKWYAISEMYSAIYENLSGGLAWYLFGPFTKWYLPRFHARLQPVSLRSEFEADAKEAEVTSPKTAGEALCYLAIGAGRTEDSIQAYCLQSVSSDVRPIDLAKSVHGSLREWTPEEAEECLTDALLAVTDVESTPPALAERIAALGAEPVCPVPAALSASEEYFGEKRIDIAASVAAEFVATSPYYEDLKDRLKHSIEVEGSLEERIVGSSETEDEAVRYVYAKGNLMGRRAAKDLTQAYVEKYPASAPLQYYYGLSLLSDGDDAGIDALVRSAQLSGGKQGSIYDAIYQYYLSKGEPRKQRSSGDEGMSSATC